MPNQQLKVTGIYLLPASQKNLAQINQIVLAQVADSLSTKQIGEKKTKINRDVKRCILHKSVNPYRRRRVTYGTRLGADRCTPDYDWSHP